jgi:hypothetical protein
VPIAALKIMADRNGLCCSRARLGGFCQRRAVHVMIDLWWTCDVPGMDLGKAIRSQAGDQAA